MDVSAQAWYSPSQWNGVQDECLYHNSFIHLFEIARQHSHCIYWKRWPDWLGCAQCLQKCAIPLLHSALGSSLISWWLCEGSQCLPQAPGWQTLIMQLVPNLRGCLPACVCTATLFPMVVLACIHENTLPPQPAHAQCVTVSVRRRLCVRSVEYTVCVWSLDLQFAQTEMISLPFLTANAFSFNCKLCREWQRAERMHLCDFIKTCSWTELADTCPLSCA